MTYLREFPSLIGMYLLAFAIDNTNSDGGIVYCCVEINGGKAQVFTVGNTGRHDLDHWITDPLGLMMLPDQGLVHVATHIHNTRYLMFFNGIEKTVAGKSKYAPSVHLAVVKHATRGNDLELGLGIFQSVQKPFKLGITKLTLVVIIR